MNRVAVLSPYKITCFSIMSKRVTSKPTVSDSSDSDEEEVGACKKESVDCTVYKL